MLKAEPQISNLSWQTSSSATCLREMDPLPLAQATIRLLNLTQRASALTFSSFLVLHLSAPIAGAIAPSSKVEQYSSGFMVLGRVWYQGEWSEAVVVWGSLALHVASGVLGRVVKAYERKERRTRRLLDARSSAEHSVVEELTSDSLIATVGDGELTELESPSLERSSSTMVLEDEEEPIVVKPAPLSLLGPVTLHHITGYVLLPLALHHSYLHRILPSSAAYLSLSPTLLSYSFVSYSLTTTYALVSAVGYAAVLSVGSYHALSGLRRIVDPTAPRGLVKRGGKRGAGTWKVAYVVTLASVGLGVARLAGEGGSTPKWLGRRFDVVLREAFVL